MFTELTYQDYQAAQDKHAFAFQAVKAYMASDDFKRGLSANAYFNGENEVVSKKTMLKISSRTIQTPDGVVRRAADTIEVPGNRLGSNFLFRLVVQENQHLLANGATLKDEKEKQAVGNGFDKALSRLGERALLHGVAWGFWNLDHLEILPAVVDSNSGCLALLDETTGTPKVVLQFWKIADRKPLHLRIFDPEGIEIIKQDPKGDLDVVTEKQAYKQTVRKTVGGEEIDGAEGYGNRLPVIPLYANDEKRSEFTTAIKAKIDAYDRISSDFSDNLDRANDVYWVFNNFGGDVDQIVTMMEEIQKIRAVVNQADSSGMGPGGSAEPHTIEVPYQARQTALELLERAIYKDYMALDLSEITGGSLTNVAIKAAMMNLDLKCDRFEWQCFQFVQQVLSLQGIVTENIAFKRQQLSNDTETVQNIYTARADLDIETVLKKLPFISQDEIPDILANLDAERTTGLPSLEELERAAAGDGPEPPLTQLIHGIRPKP